MADFDLADLDELGGDFADDAPPPPPTLGKRRAGARDAVARGDDGNGGDDDDDDDDGDESMSRGSDGEGARRGRAARGDDDDDDDADDDDDEPLVKQVSHPRELVTQYEAPATRAVFERVAAVAGKPPAEFSGALQQNPEYQLILASNKVILDLDNESITLHRYIRDLYAAKFPELDQLVPSPLDYVRVVQAIGNEMDMTELDLSAILPSATVMVVTVTAATTDGKPLAPEDLDRVLAACQLVIDIQAAKQKLLDFIASRMQSLAPNLSVLVGTPIAAQLVGAAGGIQALAQMPGGNVQQLGKNRRILAGMSARNTIHSGFINACDIIIDTPPKLRVKAARLVGLKCALAARIDSFGESRDGSRGREMHEELVAKIEKMSEPPPGHGPKPLPVPIEKASKRRGGRRARKMKERLGLTDMRKQMNRVAFAGKEETYQETGVGFGMLGQSGSGQVRIAQKDSKLAARAQRIIARDSGVRSVRASSGIASSLAFTPIQGLELENPDAVRVKPDDSGTRSKYFDSVTGFSFKKRTG